MLTAEQSHRLTRATGAAPMARLMAGFCQPACRSAALDTTLEVTRLAKHVALNRDASGAVRQEP